MLRSVVLFATLFAFYVALSGQIHNGFLMTAGLISAGAITFLSRQLEICDEEGVPYERTLAALRYLPWLARQIISSNLAVGRLVWSQVLDVRPSVRAHPHRLKGGFGLASYANSITLTPDTVTIEAEDRSVVVHALDLPFQADVAEGEMLRRVERLEGGGPT